jgi:hypothetical protein
MQTQKSILTKLMLFLVFCIGITAFSVVNKTPENTPVKKCTNVVTKKVIVPLHIIETVAYPQLEVIVIGKKQSKIKQDSQNVTNFEEYVEPLLSPVPTVNVENMVDASNIVCPTFPV